jgi:asparagine synthase (glutamine-hydrolysing)
LTSWGSCGVLDPDDAVVRLATRGPEGDEFDDPGALSFMCGIAGILDLRGRREPDRGALERMTERIFHRGPDEDGYLSAPGIAIGMRRLSIVGLADGQQPIYNEDRTVAVMYNGELFDYPEQRAILESKGHVFRTHSDTEVLVHLYEEHGEAMFEKLHGQYGFCLVDLKNRKLYLCRDRVGICPLHWSRQGDWFYFGSEIKAILASGLVPTACDPRGLDHIFTFFAMGTRRTMFEGVQSILPGHYLRIQFREGDEPADVTEHCYWDFNFPDEGEEYDTHDEASLVDEYEAALRRAVEIRLRADVPVVGYLSGGVDSAMVMAMASKVRGTPVPSFTVRVEKEGLDEAPEAMQAARAIGSPPTVIHCDAKVVSDAYPKLVAAADCPVIDTSCGLLWCLAREVHDQGFKVALTGEGSDEAQAGYVFFKTNKILRWLDFGGFKPSAVVSRLVRKAVSPYVPMAEIRRADRLLGGLKAQSETYSFVAQSRHHFYSDELKQRLGTHIAYEDLTFDTDRIRRWHPLNQSLYFGYKIWLAGLLLNHKGDRVAMSNSVETRYPFLDNHVNDLCSRIHPRWKLRGVRFDKYLLRQAAARYLPKDIALRPKAMFRAPQAESFFGHPPQFVEQLMSEESLRKTGYFDVAAVRKQLDKYRSTGGKSRQFFKEMGMTSVFATQLWHHLYLGGGLCELPQNPPMPKTDRPPPAAA